MPQLLLDVLRLTEDLDIHLERRYNYSRKEVLRKMTVFEYVTKNNIQRFWCLTTSGITLTYEHKSRKGRIKTITEFFTRQNLCDLRFWYSYKSFSSFLKKEVVKVSNDGDIPFIYVNFSKEDWEREIKEILLEDEKNYNYSFRCDEREGF